jgi:hypothetical protein
MTLEGPTMGSEVRMSAEMKTWLGIHTKYSRIHLGVDSRKLEQCTAECGCKEFRNTDLAAGRCWLRRLQCWCFVQSQHPPQLRAKHRLSDFINAQLQVYDVYHVAEIDVCQDKRSSVNMHMLPP